ncbi:MAG: tRNA pseudouridine(38-40) synthase TruA [Candidatus Baltobacteraceae bacterium]
MRAVVEYDGTTFSGLQWQPQLRTVAGELQRALSVLLNEPVAITAAGRTDAGVHATGQVISFRTQRDFPFDRMALALNAELPESISVRDVEVLSEKFSARFSALERAYVYLILNRRHRSALLARHAYHVYYHLELEPMQRAASYLLGEHDFRSFCGTLPESGPTRRCVKSLDVRRQDELIVITIRADSYLHRMVRNIVGTLVECGRGRRDPDSVPAIVEARDRPAAGHSAPAQGLYLAGVLYSDFNSFKWPPVVDGRPP